MTKFDLSKEIIELKKQLSYSKNIGFFLGAGTSCAFGIPDITELTNNVGNILKGKSTEIFEKIKGDLNPEDLGHIINIEDILNQLRRIRELTNESEDKNYIGVCGKDAAKTDSDICKSIFQIIREKELEASLDITKQFLAWYNLINREFTKEIFTTNYDLILEKSLEESEIPYFDGFVGGYEPFFWQESIEHKVKYDDLTQNWIRLWKIHGSLSWFWRDSTSTSSRKIIRIGNITDIEHITNELVIYPSKEKYESSRKQPFIAYFDHMRNYLLNGEIFFIISGYSFSDQHINEIILNSLRQNNRLFVSVFFYRDEDIENLNSFCSPYLNLHAFSPSKAIINGELGEWEMSIEQDSEKDVSAFWDENSSAFTLGDFTNLVKFIVASSGKQNDLGKII